MFLTRKSSEGIKGSKYWYTAEYSTDSADLQLPNCTTYVMGRSAEICGHSVKAGYCDNPMLKRKGYGNAKEFWNDANWERGSEPKVGAVCVWGSSGDQHGHVAIVEEIIGESVLVSQSNYGGSFFETKTYTCVQGKVTSGVGYEFQGYLYNPEINDRRTARDESRTQLTVKAEMLRARKRPDGEAYDGQFMPKGTYNVLEIEQAGGYKWAKIGEDTWCAINDTDAWTELHQNQQDQPAPAEAWDDALSRMQKAIERMEEEMARISNEKLEVERQLAESEMARKAAENRLEIVKALIG